MERTRHMVDIADYAWEKLERLAARVDAATYLYKGRPRYGKLIELAIEKLEDSTMEWTEEEVVIKGKGYDLIGELDDVLQDATIEMPPKGYTFGYNTPQGDPVYYKNPIQAPQDMDLYGNAYVNADTGFPIKASSISIKVSADDTSAKQLEKLSETLKDLNKGIGASTKSAQDLAEKLDLTNPYVTYDVKHPDYIEIRATLSQALSAPEQLILRKFAEAELAKYSNDTEAYAVNASIKNVPWNKLFIFASYTYPSKLTESLSDVAFFVRNRVQEWLLKGNFIGPLPQAVNIAEMKPSTANYVSGGHKFEKAIDKNGTLQTYHTYHFVVHLHGFEAIAFGTYKNVISDAITTSLLISHGYASSNIAGHARVLWNDDEFNQKIHIVASVIKNQYLLNESTVKNFIDKTCDSLVKYVQMVQKPPF